VLALHSLSKRSNLAGVRVGFYAGDAALVEYLAEIRKHVGSHWVPDRFKPPRWVALDDDAPRQRPAGPVPDTALARLAEILRGAGLDVELPAGGFYLWVALPPWAQERGAAEGRSGAWVLTTALAEAAGMLVSPGEFYGRQATGFVRVRAVQPDDRIELVATRLASSGHPHLGGASSVPGRGPSRDDGAGR